MAKKTSKIAVIIPAYNEERTISKTIESILAFDAYDIIVVNDGSTDGTGRVLREFQNIVRLISFKENCGKGAALRAGADFAVGKGYSHLVLIDADGQHSPRDIPRMISGLNEADLVINFRQMKFQASFISRTGRFVLRTVFNCLFRTHIGDHISGFRAFKASAYPKIRWQNNDYRVEIEMLAKTIINKISYVELDSPCSRRRYKGMGWGSGFAILLYIIYAAFNKSKLLSK